MTKVLLITFALLACGACRTASSSAATPVSAGALSREYERSTTSMRSRYEGKEISVRGYTLNPATMPQPDVDQGSVSLEEKENQSVSKVVCWFSREQTTEFAKIKGGQYLTVRGVFNGERGVELRFCKLVKVE